MIFASSFSILASSLQRVFSFKLATYCLTLGIFQEMKRASEQQKTNVWHGSRTCHNEFMSRYNTMHFQVTEEPGISSKKKPRFATTIEELAESDGSDTEPPRNPADPDEPEKPKVLQQTPMTPMTPITPTGVFRDPKPGWFSTARPWSVAKQYILPPFAPPSELPPGYSWADWNEPEALKQEEFMAVQHKIPNKMQGLHPFQLGAPELWRDIPFNPKENA